jgi:hypothetical protein
VSRAFLSWNRRQQGVRGLRVSRARVALVDKQLRASCSLTRLHATRARARLREHVQGYTLATKTLWMQVMLAKACF